MVFQHPSGFTALRSARRQNFWRRGSPRNFAQNGTSRAWRPRAERRSGAASRRAAKRCRRSSRWRKAGASGRPARNNTLNRRRTTYIREAKSPRPSPIHTLITHQPHHADRGGRILARPLSVRRARAHGAGVRPALPHVLGMRRLLAFQQLTRAGAPCRHVPGARLPRGNYSPPGPS